jgi:hypothetical protein
MAKKIYIILGAIALIFMIYLIINPQSIASKTIVWYVSVLYAVVIGCIHGILGHSLSAKQKGNLVLYPVAMGALFGVLAFIYLFVVLPLILPGYM